MSTASAQGPGAPQSSQTPQSSSVLPWCCWQLNPAPCPKKSPQKGAVRAEGLTKPGFPVHISQEGCTEGEMPFPQREHDLRLCPTSSCLSAKTSQEWKTRSNLAQMGQRVTFGSTKKRKGTTEARRRSAAQPEAALGSILQRPGATFAHPPLVPPAPRWDEAPQNPRLTSSCSGVEAGTGTSSSRLPGSLSV